MTVVSKTKHICWQCCGFAALLTPGLTEATGCSDPLPLPPSGSGDGASGGSSAHVVREQRQRRFLGSGRQFRAEGGAGVPWAGPALPLRAPGPGTALPVRAQGASSGSRVSFLLLFAAFQPLFLALFKLPWHFFFRVLPLFPPLYFSPLIYPSFLGPKTVLTLKLHNGNQTLRSIFSVYLDLTIGLLASVSVRLDPVFVILSFPLYSILSF